MIAHLLLAAQVAAADSVYSTPALRALVAEAAARNRTVPAALAAYEARVESEIAFILRTADGVEATTQVEQFESETRWRRTGAYEQHVTAYRAQAVGLAPSALTYLRQAWTAPVLYGNRLALFFGRDTSARGRRKAGADRRPTWAVHPLADDREAVYRFGGGDTVVTLRLDGRSVPIVRIRVEPRRRPTDRTLLFRGEVDLDAARRQVVRMRGQFLTIGGRAGWRERLRHVGFRAVAYVELVNAEVEGEFWLPAYQRVEAQGLFTLAGEQRSVLRVTSRFRDYEVSATACRGPGDPPGSLCAIARDGDTMVVAQHRLTFAPSDSMRRASRWRQDIGVMTSGVDADDFDDLAPDAWRPVGRPRLELRADRFSDVFHFNRVEGFYTGLGAALRLRDAAPGVVVHANVGRGWSDRQLRGGAGATLARGRWLVGARTGRALDNTNDFRARFDADATFVTLLGGQDDFDYVDRRGATFSVARALGAAHAAVLRVEAGPGSDRAAQATRRSALFNLDSAFRANRGVAEGRYFRSRVALEYNPGVNVEVVRPGVGALLKYERGDGRIDWQRVEGRVVARRDWRAITYAAQADAGALVGGAPPPPQQLFEIGGGAQLPGYDYKEFGGDRAAILRGVVLYNLPYLRAPTHLWRWIYLPSPSPALAVGVQGGWTAASDEDARCALAALGEPRDTATAGTVDCTRASTGPVHVLSAPSRGLRTTVHLGVRAFGGAIGVGVARAIDHQAGWRIVFGLAEEL